MRPIYEGGYVRQGRIVLDDQTVFRARVRRIPDGTRVQVRVGPPTRSDKQNNYMWLILEHIAEHTEGGHTAEDFHEYFKCYFLPKRVAIADGNGEIVDDVVIGGSTAKLNQSDFAEYIDRIRQWALERLQLETPDAEPEKATRTPRRVQVGEPCAAM